jgi:hypothetical protein
MELSDLTMKADHPKSNTRREKHDHAFWQSKLEQFDREHPQEEDLWKDIFTKDNRTTDMLRCRYCKSSRVKKIAGVRAIKCRDCKNETWMTGGTFFKNIRNPRAWLFAIWLMEQGFTISRSEFHKLLGIAYSTAWSMFQKLTIVIENEMNHNLLAVGSRLFERVICRRSGVTPAHEHPFAEQEALEAQAKDSAGQSSGDELTGSSSGLDSAARATSSKSESPRQDLNKGPMKGILLLEFDEATNAESEVCNLLSTKPIDFDSLRKLTKMPACDLLQALTMLEMKGLATNVGGNTYVGCGPAQKTVDVANLTLLAAEPIGSNVDSFIEYVQLEFHGISRKYLQLYLAQYWCHIDRMRWHLGSLLRACQQSDYFGDKLILDYQSPLVVKMFSSSSSSPAFLGSAEAGSGIRRAPL